MNKNKIDFRGLALVSFLLNGMTVVGFVDICDSTLHETSTSDKPHFCGAAAALKFLQEARERDGYISIIRPAYAHVAQTSPTDYAPMFSPVVIFADNTIADAAPTLVMTRIPDTLLDVAPSVSEIFCRALDQVIDEPTPAVNNVTTLRPR